MTIIFILHRYGITKNREDVTRTHDADTESPRTTSNNASVSPSSNNNIPQGENVVNNNISTGAENNSDLSVNESGEDGETFRTPSAKEIFRAETVDEQLNTIMGRHENVEQRHLKDVAEKLGVKLRWDNECSRGYYDPATNTIVINPFWSMTKSYYTIFKHEFVHYLEKKSGYNSFKKYLKNNSTAFDEYIRGKLEEINGVIFSGSRDEALAAYTDIVLKERQESEDIPYRIRKGYDTEKIHREIIADFVGDVLLGGKSVDKAEQALTEIAQMDRSILQKIRDWLREVISVLKGEARNRTLVEDLEYLNQRIARVYDSAETKKAAKNSGGVMYSIKKSTDGHKFVQVVNKTISDTNSAKDIAITLSNIVKNKFNDFINVSGQKIGVNNKTAREWQWSKDARYLMANSPQAFYDKMNAFNDVDELLKVSRNYISEEIKHQRKDNFIEFARGVVDFKIENRGYSADIIVGTTKTNAILLYDIVALQEKEIEDASHTAQDRRAETSSNDIILNEEDSVKNNISEESENYSGDEEFFYR